MPLQSRKRRRTSEVAPSTDTPQPPAKRHKRSPRPRSWSPPEFWDSLSQVPLCRRALQELDWRTVQPIALKPPARFVLKGDLVKQLKRFARRGGPNLRDIREYPAPKTEALRTMNPSQSHSSRPRIGTRTDASSALSQRTRKTALSSKDPAFKQALIDAGIHPKGYENEPGNMKEIMERLGQPRPSLSPSSFPRERFIDFERENDEARTQPVVMRKLFPIIEGNTAIPFGEDEPFHNLKPLGSGISTAKPDYYSGSQPKELHPRVRADLGPYIVPTNYQHRPLLPNFFMEVKSPSGNASEMKLQITQDLANGARGMLKTQSYGQDEPTYDGNAYTLGSTYHSGTGMLQLYAMHPTQPADPSGQPQYHTTRLRTFGMTDTADAFREGATWYRNARDLAQEWRTSAITTANARYEEASEASAGAAHESQSQETITSRDDTNEMVQDDTDSSLDELTSEYKPSRKYNPSRKGPKLRQPRPGKRARTSSSASESWEFADGRFHHFHGLKKVRSQDDHPLDVWVYREYGWSNDREEQWCLWKSNYTMEYR